MDTEHGDQGLWDHRDLNEGHRNSDFHLKNTRTNGADLLQGRVTALLAEAPTRTMGTGRQSEA
jgi:hypothetical protein